MDKLNRHRIQWLYNLLAKGECDILDFKEQLVEKLIFGKFQKNYSSSYGELAKDVVAFAYKKGGFIFVGITDDTKEINNDFEYADTKVFELVRQIQYRTSPSIKIKPHKIKIAELRKEKFDTINKSNLPCIELEHVGQGTGSILGYTESKNQKSLRNKFYENDILFGKLRPYLKKYWMEKFEVVCSSEIWVIKNKKDICVNKYLYYLIQTNEFIQATNFSSSSRMPRADWDYIFNFPFSIVNSLPEQQKIAKTLLLADKEIERVTSQVNKIKEQKKGLMHMLLTGRVSVKTN